VDGSTLAGVAATRNHINILAPATVAASEIPNLRIYKNHHIDVDGSPTVNCH